jgi:hypothetical protein
MSQSSGARRLIDGYAPPAGLRRANRLEAVKHRQAVVEDVGIAACPQGEEWQASRTSDPLHGAKNPARACGRAQHRRADQWLQRCSCETGVAGVCVMPRSEV